MILALRKTILHRRARDRMTHRTNFGSDAFFRGFFWAQVVDSAHTSSSSDAFLEAAVVPLDVHGTFRTDTPHPPQHHDNAHNHTHNHGQSQGKKHKVTLSRRTELGRVTTVRKSENHGSNHNPTTKPFEAHHAKSRRRAKPSQAEPCHTTPHHTISRHAKTGHAKNRPGRTKPGCVWYCSSIVWLNFFHFL